MPVGGVADSEQQAGEVTPSIREVSNPWAGVNPPVFLGFNLTWKQAVEDFDAHKRFAEKWQATFGSWKLRDRVIDLSDLRIGYRVRLQDGAAYFECDSRDAYAAALKQFGDLFGDAWSGSKEQVVINVQMQFLPSAEGTFAELTAHINEKLFTSAVSDTLHASILDVAYLADMRVDGIWRQVNIGPVQAHEIRRRVNARLLTTIPEVATYVSVTTRKKLASGLEELTSLVDSTKRIGSALIQELHA